MGRLIITAVGALAVLTVLAEALAAGLLWSQGRLNADAVREIRVILRDPDALEEEQNRQQQAVPVSVNDVIQSRAIRILHLEERESEQAVLRGVVADLRSSINSEQDRLLSQKELFEKQQQDLQARRTAAGIEKSIAVLTASDVDLAVAQLSELTLDESIILMEGMPEKQIAKLLAAFAAGDKDQVERGQQIFQAITRGQTTEAQEGASK